MYILCVHICINVYTHAHIGCTYVCKLCVQLYICMQVGVVHMYAGYELDTFMRNLSKREKMVKTLQYTQAYMCVHTYVYMYIHMYVCIYICIYVYT